MSHSLMMVPDYGLSDQTNHTNCTESSSYILHIFFLLFNLINVVIVVSAVYYWILWYFCLAMGEVQCLFALKYWYYVYAAMSKSYFHLEFNQWRYVCICIRICTVCAISLWDIVIFAQYDFIYRCHYVVCCFALTITHNRSCFKYFFIRVSVCGWFECCICWRSKSDLPTLSLPMW